MQRSLSSLTSLAFACALSVSSLFSANASAYNPHDDVDTTDMFLDAVAVRPLTLATTVIGTAAFVISSPFSLFGGNIEDSFEQLVLEPAKYTIARPLGHMEQEPLHE